MTAHELGYLKLGNISLDGSKIHADASKSKAVSYGRLLRLETHLRAEVEDLLPVGDRADRAELPEGLDIELEVSLRQKRLVNLEQAQAADAGCAGQGPVQLHRPDVADFEEQQQCGL